MAWLQLLVPMAWLLSPYCVVSHVLETKSGEIHEVQHHHHHHHDASCTSTPWGPWEKCHKVGYYEGGAYAPFFRTCNGEMYARREVYGANCKAANKKRKFCTIAPEDCELEPQAPGGTDNHASGFNVQAWTNKKPVLIEGVRHTVSGTDEIDAKSCEYGGQRVRHGWSGAGIGKRYRCETCTCVFGEMECMEDADRCSLDDPYHPRFCSHTVCRMLWSWTDHKYTMTVSHPGDKERKGHNFHCSQFNGNEKTCSCFCFSDSSAPTAAPTSMAQGRSDFKDNAKAEAAQMIQQAMLQQDPPTEDDGDEDEDETDDDDVPDDDESRRR